jgi:hypothetical protein
MHRVRTENLGVTEDVDLTRRTAIFRFCKECMGFQVLEVEPCTDLMCPLYPFRNTSSSASSSKRKSTPKAIAALKTYRDKRSKK